MSSRCHYCRKYKTRAAAPVYCRQNCWMQWAMNPANKGTLHAYLGVPQGRRLPDRRLMALSRNPNVPLHVRRRANLALVMRGYRKK